jgi:predicted translin family RNA/ssDNA-binding protein
MALIAEKETAISLILNIIYPAAIDQFPGLRGKLDVLQKQKEAIKHSLLIEKNNTEVLQNKVF